MQCLWGLDILQNQHVFGLQKRALTMVFHLRKYQSYRSNFRRKNVLTIPSIYVLESLSLYF